MLQRGSGGSSDVTQIDRNYSHVILMPASLKNAPTPPRLFQPLHLLISPFWAHKFQHTKTVIIIYLFFNFSLPPSPFLLLFLLLKVVECRWIHSLHGNQELSREITAHLLSAAAAAALQHRHKFSDFTFRSTNHSIQKILK